MNIGKSRLMAGVFLALTLSAQEGDIAQKEKAQRDKQLQERNAQPKTAQPDKTAPPANTPAAGDPSSVGTAGRKKTTGQIPKDKTETVPPKPEIPPQ